MAALIQLLDWAEMKGVLAQWIHFSQSSTTIESNAAAKFKRNWIAFSNHSFRLNSRAPFFILFRFRFSFLPCPAEFNSNFIIHSIVISSVAFWSFILAGSIKFSLFQKAPCSRFILFFLFLSSGFKCVLPGFHCGHFIHDFWSLKFLNWIPGLNVFNQWMKFRNKSIQQSNCCRIN